MVICARTRLLLVIAHPDDEAMFFAPLLSSLAHAGGEAHILCLTNGDGGGDGGVRARELLASAAALGVPPARVALVAHALLRDGAAEAWDGGAAAGEVAAALARARPTHVATFDAAGVTRHANHCATHLAVVRALRELRTQQPRLLLLHTLPLWQRFLGPLAALCSAGRGGALAVHAPGAWPWAPCHSAMRCHASQYVWYRRLWVAFSSYSVLNTFEERGGGKQE